MSPDDRDRTLKISGTRLLRSLLRAWFSTARTHLARLECSGRRLLSWLVRRKPSSLSARTGEARQDRRTDEREDRSGWEKEALMCGKRRGKMWAREVRKAWEGGDEEAVDLEPMESQVFQAADHSPASSPDTTISCRDLRAARATSC